MFESKETGIFFEGNAFEVIARSWDSLTADCVCTPAGFCEIVLKVQEGRNVGRLKLDNLCL
jgi:hypothetical protein